MIVSTDKVGQNNCIIVQVTRAKKHPLKYQYYANLVSALILDFENITEVQIYIIIPELQEGIIIEEFDQVSYKNFLEANKITTTYKDSKPYEIIHAIGFADVH
jgi:hypothetical protein